MKKLNAIQNIARLVLILVLAAMIFLPSMTLKLYPAIPMGDKFQYILTLSDAAFSYGVISEEEYKNIAESVIYGGSSFGYEYDENLPDDLVRELTEADQAKYVTMIETGDVENRFEYSQSLLSAVLSLPDTITLVRGTFADTKVTAAEAVNAINENSVQNFMLVSMLLNVYTGIGNFMYISPLVLTVILLVFCFIILPVKFFIAAIKEIVAAIRKKGEWLYGGSDPDGEYLTPLGVMLLVPLFLRGSSFTALYFVAVIVALIWLAVIAFSSFRNVKGDRKPVIISVVFFAAGIILAGILGAKLLSYDALAETFNNLSLTEPTDMSLTPIPRILVAFCALIVINYIIGSIVRLVTTTDGVALAKYVRFIFVALAAILYGIMTNYSGGAGLAIGLSVVLFAVELAYSIYRNKAFKSALEREKTISDEE